MATGWHGPRPAPSGMVAASRAGVEGHGGGHPQRPTGCHWHARLRPLGLCGDTWLMWGLPRCHRVRGGCKLSRWCKKPWVAPSPRPHHTALLLRPRVHAPPACSLAPSPPSPAHHHHQSTSSTTHAPPPKTNSRPLLRTGGGPRAPPRSLPPLTSSISFVCTHRTPLGAQGPPLPAHAAPLAGGLNSRRRPCGPRWRRPPGVGGRRCGCGSSFRQPS